MGSKNNPGKFDCYANALPDEPMFVLLARDPAAWIMVHEWADDREQAINEGRRPEGDRDMVAEARMCADNMKAWRKANDGAWRHPKAGECDCESRFPAAFCPVHGVTHKSDCALHNMPAMPAGPCDCGALPTPASQPWGGVTERRKLSGPSARSDRRKGL